MFCHISGVGSQPSPLTDLAVYLGGKGWFSGALLAGLLSANIANLINMLVKKQGVMYMLLNIFPLITVSLIARGVSLVDWSQFMGLLGTRQIKVRR